jgi:CubicO group peptidase (beta-lactamase class C family)
VFSYSNIGYLVAGRLIEIVTGMTWIEATDAILLSQLDVEPRSDRPAVCGHSVEIATGRVLSVLVQPHLELEAPSCALALSASDLVALVLANPCAAATLAEMRRDQLVDVPVGPFGMADSWGLGWAVHHRGDRSWFGHDGTGEGTSCHLRFDPLDGTVVALTTNADTGLALWEDLVAWLRAGKVDIGSHSYTAPDAAVTDVAAPPDCVGRYVNGDVELDVAIGDDGILSVATAL